MFGWKGVNVPVQRRTRGARLPARNCLFVQFRLTEIFLRMRLSASGLAIFANIWRIPRSGMAKGQP